MSNIVGMNVRGFPSPDSPTSLAVLVVVLVQVHDLTYRAYGAVLHDHSAELGQGMYDRRKDWIADHGSPMPLNEARGHFPSLTARNYSGG